MIKGIKNINYGIFKDYTLKPPLKFEQYNLIYGFNGSGKTTLARILKSLEINADPLDEASFKIETSDDVKEKGDNVDNLIVFNSDFVRDNVSLCFVSGGSAKSLVILGKERSAEVSNLEKINESIATEEKSQSDQGAQKKAAENEFGNLRTDVARRIEGDADLGRVKYNAPKLKVDMEGYQKDENDELMDYELSTLQNSIRREAPPTIPIISIDTEGLKSTLTTIRKALKMPSMEITLADIENNPEMMSWVAAGHEFHTKNKRGECLYCGEKIPPERLSMLSNLFDSSYRKRVDVLESLKRTLESERIVLEKKRNSLPKIGEFDKRVESSVGGHLMDLDQMLSNVIFLIGSYIDAISQKFKNLTTVDEMLEFHDDIKKLETLLQNTNSWINEHNKIAADFETARTKTQDKIKKHHLFLNYDEFKKKKKKFSDCEDNLKATKLKLEKLRDQKNSSLASLGSERIAAKEVNELLKVYLGHSELQIEIDEQSGVKGFVLLRDGKPINNGAPSEGEKSALALVYFLVKLKEGDKSGKKRIVVIDDPVSSMDDNAMTYAANLIWERVKDCEQVFFLTHNLQFMNTLKKRLKRQSIVLKSAFFVIEANASRDNNDRHADIRAMPKLIRNHDSEYNYCFYLVRKFYEADDSMDCAAIYQMPNLMRKVIETFLEFTLPQQQNLSNRSEHAIVTRHLSKEEVTALVNLVNVDSHSDSQDAILQIPNFAEYHRIAGSVMKLMCKINSQHFAEMCKMVDKP